MKTYSFLVKGIVQGVGFRPFIFSLAQSMCLKGTVKNSGEGVYITVNTDNPDFLLEKIIKSAPPLAVITEITYNEIDSADFIDFSILQTESHGGLSFVPPDTAVCSDCLADIRNSANRRYGYAFTNCTNCGPRYTIIRDMPYDREKTVMDAFLMCPECRSEYETPSDRRFHAQPNACSLCGPMVYCKDLSDGDAIVHIAKLIDNEEIVAVKGLGGYHLVCDATSDKAVQRLRDIKHRPDKPLAIMCLPETLENLNISNDEKQLLFGSTAPIVIIKDSGANISSHINPMSRSTGFLTTYTPLHTLLLQACRTDFIVATSGNLKDEPIAKDETTAEQTLACFTEHFLHHNREIHNRCDDSLAAVVNGSPYILRRARGLAPFPVMLPAHTDGCILGVGAHLKNTVSLAKDSYCFVSQFIGDLDHPDTCTFYNETISKLTRLYGISPDLAVHDLHPNYHSTLYAKDSGLPSLELQHHAAHMFACMAENGLTDNVLGVIMDGTGLGTDKTIWGGEFLLMKNGIVSRAAHMPKVPQPGMDGAAKNPARMLVSYLNQFGLLDGNEDILHNRLGLKEKDISMIISMIDKNINTIQTTSCGRYFESVGSLITNTPVNLFEAHSAMKLEGLCSDSDRDFGCLPPCELLSSVISDIRKGTDPAETAEAFHNSFALWLAQKTRDLCAENGISNVVLSGGVFQNIKMLKKVLAVNMDKLCLYTHKRVSPNDSCISLGQCYYGIFNKSTKIVL